MKNQEFTLPHEIYEAHLKDINDVKFTPREIEIIAFILCGRSSKKTASFFSISPKTVENHTRNIMGKLGCNSRENIIDFIERSGKFWFIKKYYVSLLIHSEFESILKAIALSIEKPPCLIVHCQSQEPELPLMPSIKEYLKVAGVDMAVKIHKKSKSFLSSKTTENSSYRNLFILPTHQEMTLHLTGFDCLELSKQKNYYFLVFQFLKRVLPQQNVEDAVHSFQKKVESLCSFSEQKEMLLNPLKKPETLRKESSKSITQTILKKWSWCSLALFLGIGLGGFWFLIFNADQQKNFEMPQNQSQLKSQIRSDLALPHEAVLLKRQKILGEIEEKFKNQKEVQTVALIGVGGAGKTTLARQYARLQNAPIVWEINAETRESLMDSFEDLARALAKTEKDQKVLTGLQDVQNSQEREEKLIKFVNDHLIIYSSWFLIFDNVEKFTNIKKYLPNRGQGKIIITSRNDTIINNNHIKYAFQIGSLSPSQKYNLFTKIMNNGDDSSLVLFQKEEIKNFLKEIPSFPLDISMAAYYIKSTNTTYNQYLNSITLNTKNFVSLQAVLLKESGDYLRTRYGIITLSLQHIINSNQNLEDLFLLLGLLDSKNIPRDLLTTYKSNDIVDNFIYHLKKCSLVTNKTLSSSLGSAFSIHRSTQAIILIYLTRKLSLEKNLHLASSLSHMVENYTQSK